MLYPELRAEVCAANRELPKNGLVVWTAGNVSAIVRSAGHVIIKPSGVLFDDLTPESMVVVDLDGRVVEGRLKPSVDLGVHLYVYRHRPDVGGICHTHSPYATSFALLGQPIPVALTPIAHLLGRDVPCSRYARPADDDTGRAIVETTAGGMAVLVNRHGPFTLAASAMDSVKIAAQIEESARTIHYAMMRGPVTPLPAEELKRSYDFYHSNYGQKPH